MTREEALRELMDIRDEATAYPDAVCYVTSEDEDALNVAIEALSDEPVQGEWIPVSERLPEKDELVLVTVWNDVNVAWRGIYGGWDSVENIYGKGDVKAWMPLPEPYREDGK